MNDDINIIDRAFKVLLRHLLGKLPSKLRKFPPPNIFGQVCCRIKNPVIAMNTLATVSHKRDTNNMAPTTNDNDIWQAYITQKYNWQQLTAGNL